nr:hypothetical protein [Posidoniimonas corsicana]
MSFGFGVVPSTVELDNDLALAALEVDYKRPNRELAPEPAVTELPLSQPAPKLSFSLGLVAPQRSGECALVVGLVHRLSQPWFTPTPALPQRGRE